MKAAGLVPWLRYFAGALIGTGATATTTGTLPAPPSIALLAAGVVVFAGEIIWQRTAPSTAQHLPGGTWPPQKGNTAMNLDQLLGDFKKFLVDTAGTEEAAVQLLGGTAAAPAAPVAPVPPVPVAVAADPGLASVVASIGTPAVAADPTVPAAPVAPVAAPVVEPAPAPAIPVAESAGAKTFDDLVGEVLDALRLAPTPDQIAKIHDFSVNLLKLVGVQI